jgi:NAD(P)H dehydrogenase (quinone)
MCAITTEASASTFGPRGLHGDLRDILYPIHHGILYYVGFEVLPPFVVYAPGHMDDETRAACLLEFEDRMLTLDTATPIPFPELADYDDAHQLRPAYRTAD